MRIAGRLGVLVLVIGVFGACSSRTRPSGGSPTTRRSSVSTRVTSTTRKPTASTASSPSWATYDGDAGRSGVATDGPSSPSTVRRRWMSSTLDGDVYAQRLVVGGRVIIATEHDTVCSLNA